MTDRVLLGLGTNLGQRLDNLQSAIHALGEVVAVEALSPVYETEPWGVAEQPKFLNMCLAARTRLEPLSLLTACKAIETQLGRSAQTRWGPRVIDIDILYFGQEVVEEKSLRIPHASIAERAFVLVPLATIAPEHRDPASDLTVGEMLGNVDRSGVRLYRGGRNLVRRPSRLLWGAKTYVMGILNITPDSFSGDGLSGEANPVDGAVQRALEMVQSGADVLDVGGESTRPGSRPIAHNVEMDRVIPVVKALREAVDVPISIDTYRAQTAEAALAAGADWINDVWGLRMDRRMIEVAASAGCPLVIMHNRSKPKNAEQEKILGGRYVGIKYRNLLEDVCEELLESIELAIGGGVKKEQIIIDPGIGFGKTVKQNLHLLDDLSRLKKLGYPLLVGTSRKSFIGYALHAPAEERLEGTAATVAIAIDRGADIVRVHDVKEMTLVAQMTDQIVRQ